MGVIGVGVIGAGVAQSLAQTGHQVVAVDTNGDALAAAGAAIRRSVRTHHLVSGSPERLDAEAVMGRLDFTTDLNKLAGCQYVIENVTEDWEIKADVYRRLTGVLDSECVVAANTSVIPISKIADATDRPDRVVGLHFMNPVPLKPVVEAIRANQTSDATVAATEELLDQMGKRPIWVADSPGFVSNRVLMLTINEAAKLAEEGVASATEIDAIFEGCFGHPMGPLATADLIGLDTIVHSLIGLLDEFGAPHFRPTRLLQDMVAEGHLGRKSGSGFHDYQRTGATQ